MNFKTGSISGLIGNLSIGIFLLGMSCGSDDQAFPLPDITDDNSELIDADFRILFVGNSLTYVNNLPKLVEEKAAEKDIVVVTESLSKANYAIIDHWNEDFVQQAVENTKYDYVIIQQGPSSQELGREWLLEYGAKFKELCDNNNTELAFYMVWPARQHYHTFDGVIKNYNDAAEANDAILLPIGKAWKEHFETTGSFDYYGPDDFHPSLKGSQAATDVMVEILFP